MFCSLRSIQMSIFWSYSRKTHFWPFIYIFQRAVTHLKLFDWQYFFLQVQDIPTKFFCYIFLNLTCKQFWPTCSLWVVVSLSEFLGWRFVRSFLSFSSTVRVLLSHRLGQVCIFGTTGDIPCPSVLSNKVAGQSQFSPPFDHLFRTIRSFFFPSRSWHLSLPLSNQLLSLLSSFLWSILWTVHSFTSNSTSS